MRVVFMGSDAIAIPLLDSLIGKLDLVGVFTQPDRPAGRGQQVVQNALKEWALARGLPVFQPPKLGPADSQDLAALKPDLALVMAYGHLLKDDFIAIPRLGTLNLHASVLPKYRGASPIQTAIASGETETGVSLMRIVRRLDAGPVADIERVPIAPLDTATEVEAKLASACIPLVARNLESLATGTLKFVQQDELSATHCRKLTKEDSALDFAAPATALAARINGLHPWPRCQVVINGAPIVVGLADTTNDQPTVGRLLADAAPARPASASGRPTDLTGTVLGADAHGLLVATGAGTLRLRRLQRPGGKLLPAPDFLRGFPIPAGTILPGTPMPALLRIRSQMAKDGAPTGNRTPL